MSFLALTGKPSDAVRALTSGVARKRSTAATVAVLVFSSYLASAYAELSQFDDAWCCVGEALAAIEKTKEKKSIASPVKLR
jgi:hypothetical protein